MGIAAAIILGVLASVIANEVFAWLPTLAEWLVRLSARLAPEEQREELRRQWAADAAAIPGPLARLAFVATLPVAGIAARMDVTGERRRSWRFRLSFDAKVRWFFVLMGILFTAPPLALTVSADGMANRAAALVLAMTVLLMWIVKYRSYRKDAARAERYEAEVAETYRRLAEREGRPRVLIRESAQDAGGEVAPG